MSSFTDSERLAALVVIDRRIRAELEELKSGMREDVLESARGGESDRKPILVGDVKVGEVGASYSKPRPYIHADQMDRAIAYLDELGLTEKVPAKGWESHFSNVGGRVFHTDTAEVVTWAGWEPSRPNGASLRGFKDEDVLSAFGPRLASTDPLSLMEGGM